MPDVHRSPRAKADLIALWNFIATDNERAADRLLDKFSEAFSLLADYPEAGRSRCELGNGIQSFPIGNYIVFYIHRQTCLDIVRVLSRYMDISDEDIAE